jgi:hypothetical protein
MSIAPLPMSLENADACARALTAATVQIELALREAEGPVEQLGELIARLAKVLGEMAGEGGSPSADEQDAQLARLRADLSGGIEKLQFYDRMVQHLSHVREYLSAISNQIAAAAEDRSEELGAANDEAWEALRARLRKRLISDPQRWLLDLVLPPTEWKRGDPTTETEDTPAAQGSIELF